MINITPEHNLFTLKGKEKLMSFFYVNNTPLALEVKWSQQLRPNDLKTLRHFADKRLLVKSPTNEIVPGIAMIPVYMFLMDLPVNQ